MFVNLFNKQCYVKFTNKIKLFSLASKIRKFALCCIKCLKTSDIM